MAPLERYFRRVRTRSGYDRLEKREKRFLAVGVSFVVCFTIFQLVVAPFLSEREKLERSLKRLENDVLEMAILQRQYQDLKQLQGEVAGRIDQRSPRFSLFSFLEKQADMVRIKGRVTYMKPSSTDLEDGFAESSVEMKLEQVTLSQLVDFLVKVESEENVVVVKRLSVQKNKKEEDLLDVVVDIVTFEKSVTSS